ncbi:MAG: biotin--[Coriobacteriales bacterium]|nr:biotin--[acetyl-CoA-carboxylase] ligase [Coriobacteriales bacterium]
MTQTGSYVDLLQECVSTDSTNNEAKKLALAGAPHGTTVAAKFQTEGRGRRGHAWASPQGGVYESIVIRPNVSMQYLQGVTAACALGTVRALRQLVPQGKFAVKWPNDVVTPKGKIVGILVEAGYSEQGVFAVCGIGVNAERPEQVQEHAEKDKKPIPALESAYLADECPGQELPCFHDIAAAVQESVLSCIDDWAASITSKSGVSGPLGPILDAYYDELVYMNKRCKMYSPEGICLGEAVFAGIDSWGRVSLINDASKELIFSPEQVTLRSCDNVLIE